MTTRVLPKAHGWNVACTCQPAWLAAGLRLGKARTLARAHRRECPDAEPSHIHQLDKLAARRAKP